MIPLQPYSDFDYLCNEPFFIPGIGTLKCPTLREIRLISYDLFQVYLNLLTISAEAFLELYGLKEERESRSGEDESVLSLYSLLLTHNPRLLIHMICSFLVNEIEFDKEADRFVIYEHSPDGEKQPCGHLGSDNFDQFRAHLKQILGLASHQEAPAKFKNRLAEKMYEKLRSNSALHGRKAGEDYTLDNMVKKFCTHNKSGINILNVWELTYYQFITMFSEYQNGRQADFCDQMAASSFRFKKSTDYRPLDYMKVLKGTR